MRLELLQYELPNERIARYPTAERDGGRLLVVEAVGLRHAKVRDLPEWVPPGALVVVNDTRVIPARLEGRKIPTGGRVEVLLVSPEGPEHDQGGGPRQTWQAMTRSSRPLRAGMEVAVGKELIVRIARRSGADGLALVELVAPPGGDLAGHLAAVGHTPLPPYLDRPDEPSDRQRYQTVYAQHPGAVAAPTAGLHFSERLLERLRHGGAELAAVTLHVGPGTFRPVTVSDLDDHPMHTESFEVPAATVDAVRQARAAGRPVVAVGTTVVRALEAAADLERPGCVRLLSGQTRLLIQPGYRFKVVDGLMTNFHLPGSTLLALVCAFAGTSRTLAAYRAAVSEGYRFYSYGDAMLLPRRLSGDSS